MDAIRYFGQIKTLLTNTYTEELIVGESCKHLTTKNGAILRLLEEETALLQLMPLTVEQFIMTRRTQPLVGYDYLKCYVSRGEFHFCINTNVSFFHEGSVLSQDLEIYVAPLNMFRSYGSEFQLSADEQALIGEMLDACQKIVEEMPEFRLYFSTGMLEFEDIYIPKGEKTT